MKRWASGIADEAWKVTICARDASMVAEMLKNLSYILGLSVEELREKSGAEIIDGLIRYQASAVKSVEAGLQVNQS